MSPRAACRLEALGFEEVYDYAAGIADWMAAGLELEGEGLGHPTASDAMRTDVPTCSPLETIGEAQRRLDGAEWDDCLVLECGRLVVGRLRSRHWALAPDTVVGDVMELGPTTIRADEPLDDLIERMDRRPTDLVVVATAQGELLGVVLRGEGHVILDRAQPSPGRPSR